MPHIVIEHFAALDGVAQGQDLMRAALDAGVGTGLMARDNVKVRLVPVEAALLGDGRESFMHVTVKLLVGRTAAQKAQIAEAVRDAIDTVCPRVAALSVDIRDMDPDSYRKRLV
ncbi:5-carboxymethyl-2-hydroxymuconate Delta-isomerase [Mesobaculum littorinae]|uniref:5-carboxymethyl-2-hydroxymuconate Delta-isomerase n=1 Tax=Mesobaculum littorinae TaxID=2486419 RepID=UPI0013E2F9AE|nr:5-carboxymethyl-2-hydroxymuconate isomerase [Mesobaculum littorinae]